jgi:Bacterial toxin 23
MRGIYLGSLAQARLRFGGLYGGYKNYRIGTNSENVRAFVQNRAVHNATKDPWFYKCNSNWQTYSGYFIRNSYSTW